MKPYSILLISLLGIACNTLAQTVTDVRFEQVNKQVKITYTLDKQADISVSVSEDGGKTWCIIGQVSGDVGKQVQPGSKTIYWDVLAEYDQLVGTNICFKVTPKGGKNENITKIPNNSRDLTFTVNGVSFTMVYVEGGIFTMGATSEQGNEYHRDERPIHSVTLSDFYIGEVEVTQGLWQAVMGTTISQQQQRDIAEIPMRLHDVGDEYPMYYIHCDDCQRFLNKLNNLLSVQLGGKRFVLPTEAQWEYAARGGQKSKGYKYSGSNNLMEVGWYKNNSDEMTHPVGLKLPNELGLFDMSGNVSELCSGWYGHYSRKATNNPSTSSKSARDLVVFRGGWHRNLSKGCRVSCRQAFPPNIRMHSFGMRLVLIP